MGRNAGRDMTRNFIPLLLLFALLAPCLAQEKPPKLIVMVLVDQFRADYVDRFREDFLPARQDDGRLGGFLFLEKEAAFHSRCFYDHWPTHTAVGHSAISTGALPSVTGIVNNYWMDRETGKKVDVSRDPNTTLVGTRSGLVGSSPFRLQAPTIGDALKLHTSGKSKVFGVALKDRAAIMATGTMADRAVWFEKDTGDWVTSTYYGNYLPEYVRSVNESSWAEDLFQTSWERTLDSKAYEDRSRSTGQNGVYDDWAGIGAEFPHPLDGGKDSPGPASFEALTFSPAAIAKTFDLAERIVVEEQLGTDDIPDLLTVGISVNDKVGHAFGPYSPEVQDIAVQTDRELARFLTFLQKRVDLDNTLVLLTSDHGVSPLPEFSEAVRLVGGRINPDHIRLAVNQALASEFGAREYVRGLYDPHLYLALEGLTPDQKERAYELATEALRDIEGIQDAVSSESLRRGHSLYTPLGQRVSQSYYRGRSGDIMLVRKPNWVVSYEVGKGTTHGSGWTQDTHVPLFILGEAAPAGRYRKSCTPRDIAPTLAELLNITPPSGADGNLLEWLTP